MHPDHLLPRTGYLKNDIPIAGVAHQAGTVRFGSDPATSVLDVNCKAHELDNLYVVDTSFFPSIGAVNPALTAIANALGSATTCSSDSHSTRSAVTWRASASIDLASPGDGHVAVAMGLCHSS